MSDMNFIVRVVIFAIIAFIVLYHFILCIIDIFGWGEV